MMKPCVLRRSMRWLAGLSLLATMPVAVQAQTGIRADYRCHGRFDAVDITAFFFNQAPSELVLVEGQSAIRLPQLPSADGGRYGAAGQVFWITGDRARWIRAKGVEMPCQSRSPNHSAP